MRKIVRQIHGREYLELFAGLALIAIQARLELLFPEYLQNVSMLLQVSSPFEAFIPSCLAMLACAVGVLICGSGSIYFIARISALISMRLRREVFNKVLDFSLKEVNDFTVPSLLNRCTFDVTQIQTFIAMLPQVIIRAPLTGIIAVINLSHNNNNYTWTGIIFFTVIVIMIFILVLIAALTPKMKLVNSLTDRLNRISLEHITGLRVIHSYNAYDYQDARFEGVNKDLTDTNIYINSRMSAMFPVLTFLMSFGQIMIYLTGAYMIASITDNTLRAMTFANMLVASCYAVTVVNAFVIITLVLIQLPRLIASTSRVNEVINSPVSIQDGANSIANPEHSGTIEFNHVSFKYPGACANSLEDINFTASHGQTVAFIGSTGCGKTSLLNLIPRLYDVSDGKILVDGVDVRDYKLEDLRSRIGYVPQKNILFTGTIAENINYSGNNSESIAKSAEIAQASEFISQRGYNSQVEHGGVNFSGGQRQRLTIARAVNKSPEIYLFDDSFSALDLVTDRKLRSSLRENSHGATILIAAQRISTIIDADKIIVIDKGHVVGEGTHSELMKTCAIYQEIAKSQTGEQESKS